MHVAKAVALIAVLVVIGIAVLAKATAGGGSGPPARTAGSQAPSTTSPTTAAAPSTTTTLVPPSEVKVQVLNGLLTGSLASQWSQKLKSNPGYTTLPPDNATSKVTASAIYILTPGYQAEANALAAAVGLPASAVNTTVPPPASAPIPASERTSANLVLVIGPELASSA